MKYLYNLVLFCLFLCIICESISTKEDSSDLLVLTVATEKTDGFKRYLRSSQIYGINVKVLGQGEAWAGGDVKRYPGGGQKVNLIKTELESYKNDKEKIVMFTDGYDVIFANTAERILTEFKSMDSRVLFSAEGFCWPDEGLVEQYPPVNRGKRFLNSGGYIGYASDLFELLSSTPIKDTDDDQLFFTKLYLDENLRSKYRIKLDHKSQIFQNLNGALGDVELHFKGKDAYLQNTAYSTVPMVIHGNGPNKIPLNTFGSYLGNSWNPEEGCVACWDDMIKLEGKKESQLPVVLMALFIEHPTPFMEEYFAKIAALEYPKSQIDLFIHNAAEYHMTGVKEFLEKYEKEYRSVKTVKFSDNIKEWHARNLAVDMCVSKECEYMFVVDAEAQLDNPHALKLLIEQNRDVVGPVMIRPYKAWSNFWGSLTADGFYARSFDYMDIVNNNRRGLWNVPYLSSCYLIKGSLIHDENTRPNYIHRLMDADMAFCHNLRENGKFLYVTNRLNFGHLINSESFDTSHLNNELFEIMNNRWDWELRYLHENYSHSLEDDVELQMPCPDVFWFPVVTTRYCKELIEEMENFGRWSDGSSFDPRLSGGYENVPTVDIHMNQIGMERHWLEFLRLHVQPLQQKVFIGYYHDPPQATMNFVVRYKPDEQDFLKPHHDSSTYTINLALNRPHIDYEGGGARFIRYNCSVTESRPGWLLMHPGRLTHFHEGLKVTKGTRYIMVSFVDP